MDAAQDHGKAHSAQHEFWHHLSASGRERDLCGSFCRRRIHEAGTSLLVAKKYYRKIQVPSPALLKVSVTRLYISVANNSRGGRAPREPTLTKIIVPLQHLDLTAVFGKTEGRQRVDFYPTRIYERRTLSRDQCRTGSRPLAAIGLLFHTDVPTSAPPRQRTFEGEKSPKRF